MNLQEYQKLSKDKCKICGIELNGIEFYRHEGGWTVEGFEENQWLYRHCPKCEYDWNLEKLGVARNRKLFK